MQIILSHFCQFIATLCQIDVRSFGMIVPPEQVIPSNIPREVEHLLVHAVQVVPCFVLHCIPLDSYLKQNSPNLASGPASSYPVPFLNAAHCVSALLILCQMGNTVCKVEPSHYLHSSFWHTLG